MKTLPISALALIGALTQFHIQADEKASLAKAAHSVQGQQNALVAKASDVDRQGYTTVTTKALAPDTVYSVWWVSFKNTRYCSERFHCRVDDLQVNGGNPRINEVMLPAGELLTDSDGNASEKIKIPQGAMKRKLGVSLNAFGKTDIFEPQLSLILVPEPDQTQMSLETAQSNIKGE